MVAGSPKERSADLESLTGLRFVAAGLVLLAHVLVSTYPGTETVAALYYLRNLSAVGMSVFFVLSGFVIAWNYLEPLQRDGWQGGWNFMVARFARLYPLYLALLLIAVFVDPPQHRDPDATDLTSAVSLVWFLAMMQSWVYGTFGNLSLVYAHYDITWSISTEWFLYLSFFGLVPLLAGLGRVGWLTWGAALALGWLVTWIVYVGQPSINTWGLEHFGPIAHHGQHGILRWVAYFAPYVRVTEFLMGALVARHYAAGARLEGSAAVLLPWIALLLAAASFVLIFGYGTRSNEGVLGYFAMLHRCFGFAPALTLLIYALIAAPQHPLARLLSSRPAVRLGESSYAIYLIHPLVILYYATQLRHEWDQGAWYEPLTAVVGLILVVTVLSLCITPLFEYPMRRLLRRWLGRGEEGWARPATALQWPGALLAWGLAGLFALSVSAIPAIWFFALWRWAMGSP